MGFFDFLGFKDGNKKQPNHVNENGQLSTQNQNNETKYSSFDNGLANSFIVEDINKNTDFSASSSDTINFSNGNNGSVNIYTPVENKDVRMIVERLRAKETCIINLGNLSKENCERITLFLTGAIYALKGTMKHLQGDLFLLTPEGMKVKSQS